jgi:hypothetical protein
MSSNKRASKETAGSGGSKKKKQLQSTLFPYGDEVLRGLNKAHKGKCLLIPAKVIFWQSPLWSRRLYVPIFCLFCDQDHKTLVIQYDERCICNASDAFQDFPLHDENEETINN